MRLTLILFLFGPKTVITSLGGSGHEKLAGVYMLGDMAQFGKYQGLAGQLAGL